MQKSGLSFPVRVSPEVRDAIASNKPVVALESTIISHGLPFPQNVDMALSVEKLIRDNGAIPATCAFLDGVPCVGLNESEVQQLGEAQKVNKVSRRDVAVTMANGLNGGTTIATTMILAELAGIKVFATGGLGGVHRGAEITMDISADLDEFARTAVAVVCSGPKSILDIEKTMEYLETKGVLVSTMGKEGTNVPGFFVTDSGIKSPYNFQSVAQAASIIHYSELMRLNSGQIFCVPPPAEIALDNSINAVIDAAVKEALSLGIKGKDITPFLLSTVAKKSGGKSVKTNIEFVKNNAIVAAGIAKEVASLRGETISEMTFTPSTNFSTTLTKENAINAKPSKLEKKSIKSLVIGSLAQDTISALLTDNSGDSNPGSITTSVGGVGHNVALAASFASRKYAKKGRDEIRLVSIVGQDAVGMSLLQSLTAEGLDNSGVYVSSKPDQRTAQYVSMHKDSGELIVACADMSIIEKIPVKHLREQIVKSQPKWLLFDANLSEDTMNELILATRDINIGVVFEPTSSEKCKRLAKLELGVFPLHSVNLSTPTYGELANMHAAMKEQGKFDDLERWFPVLDALGVNSQFREVLTLMGHGNTSLRKALKLGIIQQALSILPYIPSLAVKNGADGVLMINITQNADIYESHVNRFPHDGNDQETYKPSFTAVSKGTLLDGGGRMGVLVQHFPIPKSVENIKNVTGAGDSLMGVIMAELGNSSGDTVSSGWLYESNAERSQVLWRGMRAAGLSLQCDNSISKDIQTLE
ncbi:hypothetical protein BABINDRAFT_171627 [Babjeviella inositovora NRRL Y-12698]|uniref:Carbohydrate kinase PfkB domain-containing protein n=1 Tax=Babjeviella inositovora NRRL Y-12698 TaxID=984486 RepID=A0A1E3QP14_9ASCO|nr:uncharacterized protein BABINDRAFT_171627 [Babjeviella inositovora NRRL Y-12698]ODQ79378.1 hypothetical protein BABINDRAFT_171627 [Babjeviella inositovora NRRL Y-12698]